MSTAATPDPPLPPTTLRPGRPLPVRTRYWARWFFSGLVLWTASVVVTYWTDNSNLMPTVVLLGSFLVPCSFVVWAHERYGQDLGTDKIINCFAAGGVIGVLGASLLEYYLLHSSIWLYVGVGLIEEAVKAWVLILLTRRIQGLGVRHGLVLGATVGFGFAAFETAGYAFNAVLTEQGLSLRDLVSTELLRGVLAPVGHGLWTAILGGELFRERRFGHFVFNRPVILTYLGVSALHALWDSSHGIAAWIVARVTARGVNQSFFDFGFLPRPNEHQVALFAVLSTSALVIVAALGLGWLYLLIRSIHRSGLRTGPQPHHRPPAWPASAA